MTVEQYVHPRLSLDGHGAACAKHARRRCEYAITSGANARKTEACDRHDASILRPDLGARPAVISPSCSPCCVWNSACLPAPVDDVPDQAAAVGRRAARRVRRQLARADTWSRGARRDGHVSQGRPSSMRAATR